MQRVNFLKILSDRLDIPMPQIKGSDRLRELGVDSLEGVKIELKVEQDLWEEIQRKQPGIPEHYMPRVTLTDKLDFTVDECWKYIESLNR